LAVIAGPAKRKEYTFFTAQGSEGCGRTPLPPTGEKWVMYFDRFRPDRIVEAFPLSLVREHDPRLANVNQPSALPLMPLESGRSAFTQLRTFAKPVITFV